LINNVNGRKEPTQAPREKKEEKAKLFQEVYRGLPQRVDGGLI